MSQPRRGRAKGLGTAHDKQREKLLRGHVDGSPCWWCGLPMFRQKDLNHDHLPLAADHSQARKYGGRLADRLLHYSCNSSRKDGSNDHLRPALKEKRSAFDWGEDL